MAKVQKLVGYNIIRIPIDSRNDTQVVEAVNDGWAIHGSPLVVNNSEIAQAMMKIQEIDVPEPAVKPVGKSSRRTA